MIELVRAGDTVGLVRALAGLSEHRRQEFGVGLTALRKELRWSGDDGVQQALLVAGMGCLASTEEAADWFDDLIFGLPQAWQPAPVVTVIGARPGHWQASVVELLAERPDGRWQLVAGYPVLEAVVRAAGLPVPVSDTFVTQWMRHRSGEREWPVGLTGCPSGRSLWERLSADSFAPVLVPRVFELPDAGYDLVSEWNRPEEIDRWPACLARLADQGVLDRPDLIERCLVRLRQGDLRDNARGFLKVLQALAPAAAENAGHVDHYLALLDARSAIAGCAQQALAELDDAGLLPAGTLGKASAVMLARPEKTLVRAQLAWLDRTARRHPERAVEAAAAAACAVDHADAALRVRAVKISLRAEES